MNHRQRRQRIRELPGPLDRFKPKGQDAQIVQLVQATVVVDNAPQTVTSAKAQRVKREGTGALEVRWWNDGPDDMALGGVDVSVDGGCPVLVGEGFVESLAPNAEWWAISKGTSKLRMQVLK